MNQFCIYLDWDGFTPEVWAAWTQAILSVVAIFAASSLARRQERLSFRRKAEACAGLIKLAIDIIEERKQYPLSRITLTAVTDLKRQMETVNLDAAPDSRLIICVNGAATVVAILDAELQGWATKQAMFGSTTESSALRDINTALTRLDGQWKKAQLVVDDAKWVSWPRRFWNWSVKVFEPQ